MKSKVETKKLLVMEIQNLARKLGRTPTAQDIVEARVCSMTTVASYFGKLSSYQKAAGLDASLRGNYKIAISLTKEECMDELRRLTKKLKRLPSWDDLAMYAKYHPLKIMSVTGGIRQIAKINELRRILNYELGGNDVRLKSV